MEDIEPVTIIGGGPSGAYCAYDLCINGIYPIIINNSYPQGKPCGGRIQLKNIQQFSLIKNILEKARNKKIATLTDLKIAYTGNNYKLKSAQKGYNISRKYFDKQILKKAIQKGAKIINERANFIQRSTGFQNKSKESYWIVKTKKQRIIRTKILVGADGVRSLVRWKIFSQPISKENLGKAFGFNASGIETKMSSVKFLESIPGYIWIFPKEKLANIGIASELKYGNQLHRLMKNYINSYVIPEFPNFKIKAKSEYYGYLPHVKKPEFFNKKTAGEDWILVGDAAGHVNPFHGEGIPYALWSGKLASKAIQENNLKAYQELWRKEYGSILTSFCKLKATYYDSKFKEKELS